MKFLMKGFLCRNGKKEVMKNKNKPSLITGDKLLNIEDRLFLVFSFYAAVFSAAFILPVNIVQSYPIQHTVFVLMYIFLSFIFWFVGKKTGIYMKVWFIISTFIMLNVIWFYNAGSGGSIPFFVVQNFIFTVLLLKGWQRTAVMIFHVVDIAVLFLLEYYFPDLVHPYATIEDRFFDISSGILLNFGVNLMIVTRLMSAVKSQKHVIQKQIDSMSDSERFNSVTKLCSKRFMELKVEQLYSSIVEIGEPLSVIMFRINNLEKLREKLGVAVYIKFLNKTIGDVKKMLRVTDIFCSDDDISIMTILLPLGDLKAAAALCKKIRVIVEEEEILSGIIKLTATFGIAQFTEKEDALSTLVRSMKYLDKHDDYIKSKLIYK
jgi:GGDEF domain-containing protein